MNFPLSYVPNTRLPTPVVSRAIVRQPIDLKPMGNTVAVTTLADNPFEGRQSFSVVTQASGGMAGVDDTQMSQGLMLSGDTEKKEPRPPGAWDLINSAITGGTNIFAQKEAAKMENAKARISEQNRLSQESRERQSQFMATLNRTGSAMVQHKAVSIPLLAVAVVALGVAGFLYFKKKSA